MPIELLPNEVHLWQVELDRAASRAPALERCLAEAERERAGRFRPGPDRDRFIATRGVLRHLLARYLAVDPAEPDFRYGHMGKPELTEPWDAGELHFNLSHSGGLALLALARGRRVGVDLERVREVSGAGRVAERVFPPADHASWLALPPEERHAGFFLRWTRLEALAKLHGEGVFRVARGPLADSGATIVDLRMPPGYVAALAVDGEAPRIKAFEWEAPP